MKSTGKRRVNFRQVVMAQWLAAVLLLTMAAPACAAQQPAQGGIPQPGGFNLYSRDRARGGGRDREAGAAAA
jgi:hypothetical protein